MIVNVYNKLNKNNSFQGGMILKEVKGTGIYNNKLVGIESYGDPGSAQGETLDDFAAQGCEVIICASRTRGGTRNRVEQIASKFGYQLITTSNFYGGVDGILSNNVDLNDEFADAIVRLVDKL